ncbi:hypothetical protein [Azospirillum sp. ST 5-10]|uniref:hypothetical protein n=1 Tax=unclassified Azospirillum TaxID=2630922 RepID=UPI003F4A8105
MDRNDAAADAGRRHLEFVLATVNAPRPRPMDADTFLRCLFADAPDARWRPHMEAFFDEVSEEAIHDLVLAGLVGFDDLRRAVRIWQVSDGRTVPWIEEMAGLPLARPAAGRHPPAGQSG